MLYDMIKSVIYLYHHESFIRASSRIQWSLYRKANRFAEHFWPHKGVRPHERGNFSNADGS